MLMRRRVRATKSAVSAQQRSALPRVPAYASGAMILTEPGFSSAGSLAMAASNRTVEIPAPTAASVKATSTIEMMQHRRRNQRICPDMTKSRQTDAATATPEWRSPPSSTQGILTKSALTKHPFVNPGAFIVPSCGSMPCDRHLSDGMAGKLAKEQKYTDQNQFDGNQP